MQKLLLVVWTMSSYLWFQLPMTAICQDSGCWFLFLAGSASAWTHLFSISYFLGLQITMATVIRMEIKRHLLGRKRQTQTETLLCQQDLYSQSLWFQLSCMERTRRRLRALKRLIMTVAQKTLQSLLGSRDQIPALKWNQPWIHWKHLWETESPDMRGLQSWTQQQLNSSNSLQSWWA